MARRMVVSSVVELTPACLIKPEYSIMGGGVPVDDETAVLAL